MCYFSITQKKLLLFKTSILSVRGVQQQVIQSSNAHAGFPAAVREMRPRFSPKCSEGLDRTLESSRQTSNAFI